MISKVEGIIVSETAYGDTSKIINVFTKEHGLIGIMAKGVKSLKSKLRSSTARFTYGTFHIYYKENRLSTLIAVDVVNNLNAIKTDITLVSYMSYITELVVQVFKQSEDISIYDLYVNTLLKLEEKLNPLVLTNILEIKLLDYLGIGLNLDSCIKCGSTNNIVTIDPDYGGYVCNGCYINEKIVDSKSIKLLRMYYYIDIKSVAKLDIKDDISFEINNFLERYYDRYTGLYLKSKNFLNKILKINTVT